MKKALVVAAVLLTQFSLEAQQDVRGTAEITLNGKKISIEYGRPSLRGRDMLAKAEPGMIWRMGMNAPTTMKTEANLQFGGVPVPAGDYKLQAKYVGADQWELMLQWRRGSGPPQGGSPRRQRGDVLHLPRPQQVRRPRSGRPLGVLGDQEADGGTQGYGLTASDTRRRRSSRELDFPDPDPLPSNAG